ncbi:MAG TPA: OstA-like protein [Chitinophagaceae bacterium]|nr:OstA-like protein [Chitinophagaceae bacterium]
MILKKITRSFIVACLLASPLFIFCQELPTTKTFTPSDTVRTVEILPGVRKLEYRKIDSVTEIQILAGNVRLKQGNSIFECDSCVITKRLNLFEAFGNVHINDSDTAHVWSDHLRYLTDRRIAYLDGNVKLTDGKGTLTTPTLEYDVNTKVGIYRNGGKVVNEKTVLTSEEGFYYADLKDVYFKKNVRLKDPSYDLQSDSLLYNTGSEIVRFIAETFVKDSSGRTIRTREGYYDKRTGKAEFGQNPIVTDKDLQATGEKIISDDSTGITQIFNKGIIVDTAAKRTVIADTILYNKKTESFLAYAKPLMIIEQEGDSVFVTADTLFSAKLTDLYGESDSTIKKDTLQGVNVMDTKTKDSTDRYFEAFRNVRVFSDSMQAVCDSMFYSFKDSVFRLYYEPVLWSNESQITGDTILLFTKNKKADRMQVFKNSFIASLVKPEIFNQVKSTRMDAYFIDGNIDSVRARGAAECIYYIQDEDSAFTGINQSTSDLMDVYFKEKELQRVVFRTQVKGTIWPMKDKSPSEMRLANFKWRDAERPKTKYEMFE